MPVSSGDSRLRQMLRVNDKKLFVGSHQMGSGICDQRYGSRSLLLSNITQKEQGTQKTLPAMILQDAMNKLTEAMKNACSIFPAFDAGSAGPIFITGGNGVISYRWRLACW